MPLAGRTATRPRTHYTLSGHSSNMAGGNSMRRHARADSPSRKAVRNSGDMLRSNRADARACARCVMLRPSMSPAQLGNKAVPAPRNTRRDRPAAGTGSWMLVRMSSTSRARVHAELSKDRCKICIHLRLAGRHVGCAQRFGNAPRLVVIAVGDIGRHIAAITPASLQKPIGFGDMHPGEQLRVVGVVGHAVSSTTADMRVDVAHAGNQLLGLRTRGVGRAGDEVGSAPQPPDQVSAEVGMVVDPGQRARMQQLQHQCAQAAGQHARKFGMDAPGDAVGPEDAGIAQRLIVFDGALTPRKRVEHPAADLFGGGAVRVRRTADMPQ